MSCVRGGGNITIRYKCIGVIDQTGKSSFGLLVYSLACSSFNQGSQVLSRLACLVKSKWVGWSSIRYSSHDWLRNLLGYSSHTETKLPWFDLIKLCGPAYICYIVTLTKQDIWWDLFCPSPLIFGWDWTRWFKFWECNSSNWVSPTDIDWRSQNLRHLYPGMGLQLGYSGFPCDQK